MAKKQTRRSVSLSRTTYERLRTFCETNDMSMSEFVEERIGDFLGRPRTRAVQSSEDTVAKKTADRIFTF